MSKTERIERDPYAHIRREIPKPGFPFGTRKYLRLKERLSEKQLIFEGLGDYIEETDENT